MPADPAPDPAPDRSSLRSPPFRRRLASRQRAGPTVLIVEPDPLVCALITEVLGTAGYRTLAAVARADTMRALVCEERSVALVVCDVGDGVGEGYGPGFVRDIAATAPGTPIVVVSTSIDPDLVRAFPEAAAWFGKPFSVRALVESVDELTGAHEEKLPRAVGVGWRP